MSGTWNDKDLLSGKYCFQSDPTTSPFSARTNSLGFPQKLNAGSQVVTLKNTLILCPNLTWEQRAGFMRMLAYSGKQQAFMPADFGINLFGETRFPGMHIYPASYNPYGGFSFGPATNFVNAGFYQNQWEYGTNIGWVVGRHPLSIGADWSHAQLNILNREDQSSGISFKGFVNFLEGQVRPVLESHYFVGSASGTIAPIGSDLRRAVGLRRAAERKIRPADDFRCDEVPVRCVVGSDCELGPGGGQQQPRVLHRRQQLQRPFGVTLV